MVSPISSSAELSGIHSKASGSCGRFAAKATVVVVHLTRVTADSVVIATAVQGHDVEAHGRQAFVGTDSGFLSPAVFDDAVGVFADTWTALTYWEMQRKRVPTPGTRHRSSTGR